MNGKKAKLLREVARNSMLSQPWLSYRKDTSFTMNFGNGVADKFTVLVMGKCGRKTYKGIKKKYKNDNTIWNTNG